MSPYIFLEIVENFIVFKTVCLTCPKYILCHNCALFKKYEQQSFFLIFYTFVQNQISKTKCIIFLYIFLWKDLIKIFEIKKILLLEISWRREMSLRPPRTFFRLSQSWATKWYHKFSYVQNFLFLHHCT